MVDSIEHVSRSCFVTYNHAKCGITTLAAKQSDLFMLHFGCVFVLSSCKWACYQPLHIRPSIVFLAGSQIPLVALEKADSAGRLEFCGVQQFLIISVIMHIDNNTHCWQVN